MSERERRILDYIERYWVENWTSPSVREIAREVGLASTDSVHRYLLEMTRKGMLERRDVSSARVLYRRHPRFPRWLDE